MQIPRDSKVSLDWVQKACTQNPVQKIMDPTTGAFTGNYSTGPVRLGWTNNLLAPQKTDTGTDRWSVSALFPPGVDMSLLVEAAAIAGAQMFPENMTTQGFVYHGLQSPFHDQVEKSTQYKGYTPGAFYFNAGTYFKPRIVDPRMNDIVDNSRIYPGVWAVLAVNAYAYKNKKKGISFGLQSTVIIGDDEVLGGGGVDPKKAFVGLNIQSDVKIAASFGVPVAAAAHGVPVATETNEQMMRRLGLL